MKEPPIRRLFHFGPGVRSAGAHVGHADPTSAIKFTIYRSRPSGSPDDPDIFGSQQYAPLLDLEVPRE